MTTQQDIDLHLARGPWRVLAGLAERVVKDAGNRAGRPLVALLGGGTRLMLDLKHRISDDIDLFVSDPQWLGYLSPRLNDAFEDEISGYDEEATFVKLKRPEGEIDFIVRMSLLGLPVERSPETSFLLDPMAEVLAKKLFYRGWGITARDLFDWWAIEHMAPGVVPEAEMGALLKVREEKIALALQAIPLSAMACAQWASIKAPVLPDLAETAQWALERLDLYRDADRSVVSAPRPK